MFLEQNLDDTLNNELSSMDEQEPTQVSQEDMEQEERALLPADKNFKELRQKAERLQQENARLLKERELLNKQSVSDDDIGVGADDLVEGKHLKKVMAQQRELQQRLEQQTAELRIRSQCPDIDSVLTADNIEKFRQENPELAAAIASTRDHYTQLKAAYDAIKYRYATSSATQAYDSERIAAHRNASKPRPLASISAQDNGSPLSRANAFANGLTPELQAALLKQMADSRKGY